MVLPIPKSRFFDLGSSFGHLGSNCSIEMALHFANRLLQPTNGRLPPNSKHTRTQEYPARDPVTSIIAYAILQVVPTQTRWVTEKHLPGWAGICGCGSAPRPINFHGSLSQNLLSSSSFLSSLSSTLSRFASRLTKASSQLRSY